MSLLEGCWCSRIFDDMYAEVGQDSELCLVPRSYLICDEYRKAKIGRYLFSLLLPEEGIKMECFTPKCSCHIAIYNRFPADTRTSRPFKQTSFEARTRIDSALFTCGTGQAGGENCSSASSCDMYIHEALYLWVWIHLGWVKRIVTVTVSWGSPHLTFLSSTTIIQDPLF